MAHHIDLNEYLSSDFRPEIIANRSIRETTTAQDTKVEVGPASTRIKYDLDEIDHRMEATCKENTGDLLAHAKRTRDIAEQVEQLRPSIEDVNSTVTKLDRDFLDPFNRANDLYTAGENSHRAASLARAMNWYLQLALQAQSEDYKRESSHSPEGPGAAMSRNAYSIKTLAKLVVETPDLLKLDAVQQFEKHIPALRSGLVNAASALIKGFNGIAPSQARLAAMTMSSLGANLDDTVGTHIKALIGTTVLQLSRVGNSAIDNEQAFADAQKRCKVVVTLKTIEDDSKARSAQGSNKKATGNQENTSERPSAEKQEIEKNVHEDIFWKTVGAQLDQKLRTMSVTNQTAMKTMIANKESILSSARDVADVHAVFTKYINK